jgi:site-specific DNA-methyltransferase (adenine-specific)
MRANAASKRLLSLSVPRNARQKIDGVLLLAAIPDRLAAVVVLDPQYRTGLDQLKFGNEGARQKARYRLPQMLDDDIAFFVEESARVLRPSGHLILWLDKFSIGSGTHLRYMRRAPELKVVDLICWNKMSVGMGRRARCVSEYAVVAQKVPVKAKGVWTDHRIPDCWPEAKNGDLHPHAKPHVLTDRLIRAVTKRGDLVVDPCAGGYGVLTACLASGREFVGGDLI